MSNALKKADFQEGEWCAYLNHSHPFTVSSIAEVFDGIAGFDKTLKNDRRSLVKLGALSGFNVVAKQPRDKNDRKWMRVLSLFSTAEARKTFNTLLEFKEKGIESLTPLCLLERKRFGMVFDSWLLYEYREGRESDRSHLKEIVKHLSLLHSHGYRHEDPNFGNFLIDENGTLFLIDCKGKARSGRFSDYYDFLLFEGRCGFTREEVEALIDVDRSSLAYWQAQFYRGYIRLRTKWKVLMRRKRSKDQHL